MDARTLAASATTGVCVAAIVVGVVRGPLPGDERPPAIAATQRQPAAGTSQAARPDHPRAASPSPPPSSSPEPVVPTAPPGLHATADPPWSGQPAPPPEQRLADDDAATVTELARALLIADATGAGRGHFPGVWDGGLARPCCRQVTVHQAAAGRHPSQPDVAVVLVRWSGVDHDGQPTAMTVTPLAFTRAPQMPGGWQALPAWRSDPSPRRRHGGRHGGPYGARHGGRQRRRHGGRQRARHAWSPPGGNAAGQRPARRLPADRHLLSARRRRSEPKGVLAVGVVAATSVDPHGDRAADLLARLAALAETLAGLANVRTLVLIVGTLLALSVGWTALRRLATRRALHPDRRVRLVALPTDTFDPTAEEVDRYAAQLSRVRRTVRGRLDRPAHAVRLRLDSVAGGQCVYRIEGSAQAASILRLTGYAEVDLRPADAFEAAAVDLPGCPSDRDAAPDDTAPAADTDRDDDRRPRRGVAVADTSRAAGQPPTAAEATP